MKDIKFDRKYLGVTVTSENYREVKDQRNFHNKHLRSYIKGKDSFYHGYDISEDGTRYPIKHNVQQEISASWINDEDERTYVKFASQSQMQNYLQKKFGKLK